MERPQILISGFADEAANDKTIDQQFSAFAALGLGYLSLRFIDAGNGIKNAMNLEPDEIETVRKKLVEYGLKVSSIGSPIGKVKLLDQDDGTNNHYRPFDEYLADEVTRVCELAKAFGAKLVRGFSFYHPKGENPESFLDQAVERLLAIANKCDEAGLTFGLEVEANLIGQNGEILAELHRRINHPALVLIFDGGNLVTQGYSESQIFEQYKLMKPGLGWIHIKDFRNPSGIDRVQHVDEEALKHFVPVCIGDSGHQKILEDLREFIPTMVERMTKRGVPGVFADLEPHVKGGGQFGGFSGPDGFGVAVRSFCKMCDQSLIDYHLRDFDDIREARGY